MEVNKLTEIEKLIRFLEDINGRLYPFTQENMGYINESHKKIDKVISLLQRGEKFEQMWEDIKFELTDPDDKPKDPSDDWGLIYSTIEELEQKYFPGGVPK